MKNLSARIETYKNLSFVHVESGKAAMLWVEYTCTKPGTEIEICIHGSFNPLPFTRITTSPFESLRLKKWLYSKGWQFVGTMYK